MSDTYYVWRRGDGYVSATCYDPTNRGGRGDTFTVLLVTGDWEKARDLIESERKKGS